MRQDERRKRRLKLKAELLDLQEKISKCSSLSLRDNYEKEYTAKFIEFKALCDIAIIR